MVNVFDGNTHDQVFVSLSLIVTIISSCCSATVLILIKRSKIWNLHLSFIFAMTAFELMYDMFFFSCMVYTGRFALTVISNIAVCLGGTTSSLLSNVIAAVALYVIYFRQTIDLQSYYYAIIATAMIPGMIVTIMYIMVLSDEKYSYLVDIGILGIYYYTRLASIGINFFYSICTAVTTHRMKSKAGQRSHEEIAINRLSTRMFYYPIVQAVGRSGCAWYEMEYGYTYNADRTVNLDPPYTTDNQFAVQVWMVLCIPLIAIGYLVIFLIMQPEASKRATDFFEKYGIRPWSTISQNSQASVVNSTVLEFSTHRLSELSVGNPIYDGPESVSDHVYSGHVTESIPASSRFNSIDSVEAGRPPSHGNSQSLFDTNY